jgi:hypothetical protein
MPEPNAVVVAWQSERDTVPSPPCEHSNTADPAPTAVGPASSVGPYKVRIVMIRRRMGMGMVEYSEKDEGKVPITPLS